MRSTICCFRMRCSTRSRPKSIVWSRPAGTGSPYLWSAHRCARMASSTTARSRSIAGSCSASSQRFFCRTIASSTSAGISPRAPASLAGRSRSPGTTSRLGWTCCSLPPVPRVSPFISRSARICGYRSRRAPRRHWPVPRSCSICPPATSRSARRRCAGCCAPRNRRAASPPTPIPPPAPASRRPTSPGTAKPGSSSWVKSWPRPSVSRRRLRWRPPMSISGAFARRGCGPTPLAIVRAPRRVPRTRRFAPSVSTSSRPRKSWPCAAMSSASPMCRPTRRCSPTIATKPTTFRSRAWLSGSTRPGSKNW